MPDAPRLAIISTHPIQYYAPLFQQLAERGVLGVHVFYGWEGPSKGAHDPGFGTEVTWDIPLLEGYSYTFLENTSSDPGTHHFRGVVTPGLMSAVEAWSPDMLLVFGWNYQSHLRAMQHFYGHVPVFFRGDSILLDETPGFRKWLRRVVLRYIYRYVDVALYVGQNNRTYFEAHGFRDDRLAWVPHAIDNDRFADPEGTAEEAAQSWREELDITPDAPTVVFAGKLSRKKAPDVLLEAFSRLRVPNAHLVLAGSGPEEEVLRRQAASVPNVHFVGFQNQSRMPVVYRLGDVFVLPSRGPGETWGLAINEAMACGRAVVASDKVGCAADLIESGKNGFVFPADDVTGLYSALSQLVESDQLRRKMGCSSRERIDEWSIQQAAQRLEDAVLQHLGQPA